MKISRLQVTLICTLLALATGCHFSIQTSGTRIAHKPGATAKTYTIEIEITDVSDSSNPVKVAAPKITVFSGQEASITDELNDQFITIEVVVDEGEQTIGTVQFNIAKGDRRASGKIITFVGQAAELQTGDFTVKVLIVPHPTDGD